MLRRDENGARCRRYWDPAPDGNIEWVRPDEIEQFDALFDQAVARCMAPGPVGIFLSGGLDSVSVAAVATTRARAAADREPLALSLAFPGDANEEPVQREVATALGIDQIVLDWDAAVGSRMTAAHPWLPFGTRVTVTDVATGRSVTVVIDDRGPFGPGRIIDLSPEAFGALEPLGRGVLHVQLSW